MKTIVDKTGRAVSRVNGDEGAVQLNTPRDCIAVDDPPNEDMYYTERGWVCIPPSPGGGFIFDYTTKQWIDPRTLDEIKTQKWAEIKAERDQLEFGGFEFDSNIYDSDQVSQGRIMGAAVAGVDQVWTLADNTTVELSASQLQQLYQALQLHIAEVHARGRAARQAIYEADTREKVDAVTL